MNRRRLYLTLGVITLLAGLWVSIAPFSRPLPGGAPLSFEATPEVSCQSPLISLFQDDRPVVKVFVHPRPQPGDPMKEVVIRCNGRALFRFYFGVSLSLIGSGALLISRNTSKKRSL